MSSPHATYRAIVCVDIEGFTRPDRRDPDQIRMREGMYAALERAFAASDVPAAYHEDRGDGGFFLVPVDGPQARLVEPLPFELAAELGRYNRSADARCRIRLRVALHAGYVRHDTEGVVGTELNLVFRLLDAPALREELRTATGDLAFISSAEFHRSVIRQRRGYLPGDYRRVQVVVKATDCEAWICMCPAQIGAGRDYGERIGPVEERLAEVEETLAEARRVRAETVRAICSPVPEVPDPAAVLRDRLASLDEARLNRLWKDVTVRLAEAEGAAETALGEAREALRAVKAPMRHHKELRGRLTSYEAMAHDLGRAEDKQLDRLRERVRDLLKAKPCDLVEAEAALERYINGLHGGDR
ncbi:hypothetical protein Acsp03_30800 [Actinomadura sp. NBRC 104412]|uniref:hypothetical protein n=1 Tax=Actinomadura sp. NBRC 104412 TaxID=3032203 RepID=UPI0024A3F573|nr:hypothetical protein [Actinomadura sp. NBRC 104412]GLZ05614.1 hypothetical protein Acsp03_30800 [Actinomadura sp. NBRC 104412]